MEEVRSHPLKKGRLEGFKWLTCSSIYKHSEKQNKKLLQVLPNSPGKRVAVMEAVNGDMGLKTNKCPRIDDVMLGPKLCDRWHKTFTFC